MTIHRDSKLLSKVGFRRKLLAFLTVACTLFVVFSLLWPLSVRTWQSQSEIGLSLAKRKGSDKEFKELLHEVVQRHTSVEAIERILVQNDISSPNPNQSALDLAKRVRKRMNLRLVQGIQSEGDVRLQVGLNGIASARENFFVNALATTVAQDFMMSPLASLMPEQEQDGQQIASLEHRRHEIHARATELLAQIEGNYGKAQSEWASSDNSMDLPNLNLNAGDSNGSRERLNQEIAALVEQRRMEQEQNAVLTWEVDVINEKIEQKQAELAALSVPKSNQSSPFRVASFRKQPSVSGSAGGTGVVSGLRESVDQLASLASEATLVAKSSGRGPAFSVESVFSKEAKPVGAIPPKPHLWLLMLAACGIAGIVVASYQPFASKGFEDVDSVSRKLKIPVVASLDNSHLADESTGALAPAGDTATELPQANNMVKACEWILFAGLMLVIGFCLANADIRDSFMQNPFYGFARIMWVLRGH